MLLVSGFFESTLLVLTKETVAIDLLFCILEILLIVERRAKKTWSYL